MEIIIVMVAGLVGGFVIGLIVSETVFFNPLWDKYQDVSGKYNLLIFNQPKKKRKYVKSGKYSKK